MNSTNYRMNVTLAAAGLCATLALPSFGIAEDKEPMSIESMAEAAAKTPEQHQALAAYYQGKAKDARAEAQRHVGMAESFGSSHAGVGQPAMKLHCDSLAKAAQQQAADYDAMAAEHEAMAKKATK